MIIDWEHHYLPEEQWLKKGGKKGERTGFYVNGKLRATMHPELCDADQFDIIDLLQGGIRHLFIEYARDLDHPPGHHHQTKPSTRVWWRGRRE